MDVNGNVFFTKKTVERLFCSHLPAANGKAATWTPDSGQGTSYSLAGTGSVAGSTSLQLLLVAVLLEGSSSTNSGTSIANMSVGTQLGLILQ